MPKAKPQNQKPNGNDSGLNLEQHLWSAAEQAVPAPHCRKSEFNRPRPEGLRVGLLFLKFIPDAFEEKRKQLLFGSFDPKSQWSIKDEPQRAEAAGFSLSASNEIPRSRERNLRRLGIAEMNSPKRRPAGSNERARVSHWMSVGQVRVVEGKHTFAKRVGVRCLFPSVPLEARWHTALESYKGRDPRATVLVASAAGTLEEIYS